MPLYFFHIRRNRECVEDEEGVELPDLNAARSEPSSPDCVVTGYDVVSYGENAALVIAFRSNEVMVYI